MTWHRTRIPFPWRSPVGVPMVTVVKAVLFAADDAVPVEITDDVETPLAVRAVDLGK